VEENSKKNGKKKRKSSYVIRRLKTNINGKKKREEMETKNIN